MLLEASTWKPIPAGFSSKASSISLLEILAKTILVNLIRTFQSELFEQSSSYFLILRYKFLLFWGSRTTSIYVYSPHDVADNVLKLPHIFDVFLI